MTSPGALTPFRWPAISYEKRPWTSAIPVELLSQSARRAHSGPYRAAVVPRLRDQQLSLPPDVSAEVVEASTEIARFDTEVGSELAPFASILLRSESSSSSRIENLTSGAKSVALAELGDTRKRNAVQIVGNVAAMNAALEVADHLDAAAVLTMHRALLDRTEPDIAGRWRTAQVWVGGTSYGPHLADFVAPHHEHVPALMDDLVQLVARTDLPPLALAAVAHAQFETIHPFPDGNGRTGRALIHAILRHRGLTRRATVPVSAGLLNNPDRYFATLTAYRAGDPVPIVRELAAASGRALVNGRELVADLRQVRARWEELLSARRGSAPRRLIDVVLRQPVVSAAAVARELSLGGNALRAITPLAEAGILTEFTGQGRNRRWQASEVLTALDAFAARAGWRGGG